MGLAAAKNKRKLGNDPNNTKWSRNTDSFGQKILRAQGWHPGQYLGAKDAPHAEWHTEASSAHIKVVLKDDTLGLGAKRNNGDECTGLDAFQHLLGRLNGKSDETLETERKAREDLKLSLYVERKLGAIRFVKGGWLVGDQVKEVPDEETAKPQDALVPEAPEISTAVNGASEPSAEKSKKRKADQDTHREDEKLRKKERKSKKRKADSEAEMDSAALRDKVKRKSKRQGAESEEANEQAFASPGSSKSKKSRKSVTDDSTQSTSAAVSEAGESWDGVDRSTEVKTTKKGKKEKKDKKDKRKREERRRTDKVSSDSGPATGDSTCREKRRRKDSVPDTSACTPAESGTSTPSGSGYSTPVPTGSSRYLARSRFIAQKKMAFTDSAALNQIFMIKS